MTIKIGDKEFNLDGYANTDEIARAINEAYQQGKAGGAREFAEKIKSDIEKYWYRSELDMGAENVNSLIDDVLSDGQKFQNGICDYDKDCPTCWSRAFCKEYNETVKGE